MDLAFHFIRACTSTESAWFGVHWVLIHVTNMTIEMFSNMLKLEILRFIHVTNMTIKMFFNMLKLETYVFKIRLYS